MRFEIVSGISYLDTRYTEVIIKTDKTDIGVGLQDTFNTQCCAWGVDTLNPDEAYIWCDATRFTEMLDASV